VPRVVVVGAGIAGLAAARRLRSTCPVDVEILVLEASSRVGGKLRREQVAGCWVDVGAEAMLARRPEGLAAAREVGLAEDLIYPLTTAALVRSRGANHRLPGRTLIGVPADLAAAAESGILSQASLELLRDEPSRSPIRPLAQDISVGELVEQRFGAEVVDRLVDPLLGGVYAGRARELSLDATIPVLAARLRELGGSLLEAAATLTRPAATPSPVFASVRGGLSRLVEELAADVEVRTSTTVRELHRRATGFRLVYGSADSPAAMDADAVLLATPAAKTAALLREIAPAAAAELAAIDTASMAIITMAFRASDLGDGLPDGSGLLIPAVEPLEVKAMTFTSQKWPGIGQDEGLVLMRASLGRAGEAMALQREDAELVSLVRAELATVAGVAAEPVDSHVQRWGGALPQYRVGHLDRVRRIRAAVGDTSGLAVCGASYDGVGIPACIASAHTAADLIAGGLAGSAQWKYGDR
jgi:oxygen-dependent protoporphyrinogen oxidase